MSDYPLDHSVLVALRKARPPVNDDYFRSDSPEAARVLDRLLATGRDTESDVEKLNGAITFNPSPKASPGLPQAQDAEAGSRRSAAVWISLAASIVLIGAVSLSLVVGQNSRSAVSMARGWRLAGYISQPAWTLQPAIGSDPSRLSCPSATTCYATGLSAPPPNGVQTTPPQSVVEVTHDGGVTWRPSFLPAAGVAIASITCPTTETCMLLGDSWDAPSNTDTMFTTANGGQSWTTLPMPGKGGSASLLSCATALECDSLQSAPGPDGLGLRYISNVTADGGHSWSSSPMPGTFRGYALVCRAPSHCIAAGNQPTAYKITDPTTQRGSAAVVVSSDGGVTWTKSSVPTTGAVIGFVSCPDTLHCMAVANTLGPGHFASGVLITTDGGQTWSASPSRSLTKLNLESISCSSDADCWVSGSTLPARRSDWTGTQGVILSTHDGGRIWTSEQVPTGRGAQIQFIGGIACPTNLQCLALANTPSSLSMLGQQVVLSNRVGSRTGTTSVDG
jgi:photosystem II stability/assembly factor-like uncharacterized protein